MKNDLMGVISLIALMLTVLYVTLMVYYRFVFTSIPEFIFSNNEVQIPNSQFPVTPLPKLSVIIPARNEAENIDVCLYSLMQQTYPKDLFEVIVVDDHSEDDTALIVKKYSAQNVSLISLQDHVKVRLNSYKKKAIEVAVAQASGTLIITTDADCFLPENWLQTIAWYYRQNKPVFIAAPVAIDCSLRFIEIFQALDFMALQGITAAAVHKKQMSMCNGANMAYERSAFYEAGGFTGIDDIASGDDMLLMHKIYKLYPDRVMFLLAKEATVSTMPVKTVKQFFQQRIRWASKADKYEDKRILPVLVAVYLFNFILLVLPVVIAIDTSEQIFFNIHFSLFFFWLLMLLLKTMAEIFFLFPVATFFNKRTLLWLFPLMQPFHIIYTVIAGGLGKFGSYTWKQREVK